MNSKRVAVEKLKALRNYCLDADEPEIQAMGNVLNTVLFAYQNGHEIELMNVMIGFTVNKIQQHGDDLPNLN